LHYFRALMPDGLSTETPARRLGGSVIQGKEDAMERIRSRKLARHSAPRLARRFLQPVRLTGGAVSLALALLLAPNSAQAQYGENDYAGTLTEEQQEGTLPGYNENDYAGTLTEEQREGIRPGDNENDYAGTLQEELREYNPYDFYGGYDNIDHGDYGYGYDDYGDRDSDYYAGYDTDYGDNDYNYYSDNDYSARYGDYDANNLGDSYYTDSWYDANDGFFDWWD
jgi:hypothetical protein